jgi:hypothetical protein
VNSQWRHHLPPECPHTGGHIFPGCPSSPTPQISALIFSHSGPRELRLSKLFSSCSWWVSLRRRADFPGLWSHTELLFLDRVLLLCLGLASNHDLPTPASWLAGTIDAQDHDWLIYWDGVLLTFCSVWLQTVILLISVSWVAGMSHCTQASD